MSCCKRPFIFSFIFILLFANLAKGQTMQKTINNLLTYHLINVDEEEKIRNILIHKAKADEQENMMKKMANQLMGFVGKDSNKSIFEALGYLECMRHVGNDDPDPVRSYLQMRKKESNEIKHDSINSELEKYLNQLNSAGLISSTVFSECKVRIKRSDIKDKFDLLTQLSLFSSLSQFYNVDSMLLEERKTYLTTNQISEAIIGWERSGILKHLTTEQIEIAKKQALESDNKNLNDALYYFPNVIYSFDLELANLNDPYAELVKEFSRISHGIFNPTDIYDNFSKPLNNKVTVSFTLNKHIYSKDFKIENDWIDTEIFDFVKQKITENVLPGQFYELYEGGQGANIIFLSVDQYKYLKRNKLVVFAEDLKDVEK